MKATFVLWRHHAAPDTLLPIKHIHRLDGTVNNTLACCNSTPPRSRGLARDLASLFRCERSGTRTTAGDACFALRRLLVGCLFDLASGDPCDVDGATYHVGWAFLVPRPFRHAQSVSLLRSVMSGLPSLARVDTQDTWDTSHQCGQQST